jgi:hypothetical protein
VYEIIDDILKYTAHPLVGQGCVFFCLTIILYIVAEYGFILKEWQGKEDFKRR